MANEFGWFSTRNPCIPPRERATTMRRVRVRVFIVDGFQFYGSVVADDYPRPPNAISKSRRDINALGRAIVQYGE